MLRPTTTSATSAAAQHAAGEQCARLGLELHRAEEGGGGAEPLGGEELQPAVVGAEGQ